MAYPLVYFHVKVKNSIYLPFGFVFNFILIIV